MDNVFLLAALIYATVFWTLCWRYPSVALALVFGSAPFQNDLSAGIAGVKFSFAEINLVLALPLAIATLINGERRLKAWPFLWPCIFYFLVCLASGLVQWRGGAALTSIFQMALFMFVVVPVFSILTRRSEDVLPALWTLLGVATFIALVLLALRSQYVLGLHKNGLGGSLGCAFLVAFELSFYYSQKKTWHKWVVNGLMLLIAAGLLTTLSRGAWIGTLAGVFLIAAMRRQFALVGRLAILLIPVLVTGWMMLPEESRDYATSFEAKRGNNIDIRLENQNKAIAMWENNPLLGSGIGVRKQYDATQIVLFTLAETGIFGVITLTVVFWAFFTMVWKTQKRLGRDDLAYSLLAIGGALMVARIGQGMVDHYWSRGPTMMGWAAAGMATSAFLYGPKGSYSQRLRRARALLTLHLIEMLRRRKRGEAPLPLSNLELQRANEAMALVMSGRKELQGTSAGTGGRDPLHELARRLRDT